MLKIFLLFFIFSVWKVWGAPSALSARISAPPKKPGARLFLSQGGNFWSRQNLLDQKIDLNPPHFSPESAVHFKVYTDSRFYISPKSYPEQSKAYVNTGGGFYLNKTYQHWFYDIHTKMQISQDRSGQDYLSIPSFNIGFHIKDIHKISHLNFIAVSFGRYKKQWSWIDRYWNLGLWNPQNLYDYFHPFDLGITGSALTLKGDSWSLTNLVGGLFFPHQQPSMATNKKGEFQPQSRWHTPPSSSIWMFNQNIDAYYWMKKPYLQNVLLQSSYLTQLFFGDIEDRWVSASYAYKPINQIYFRVTSGFSIEKSSVNSFIHYHPLKHHLSSIESGFTLGSWKFYLGILDERVGVIHLPVNWIAPPVPNAIFASASTAKHFHSGFLKNQFIRLSYLTSWFRGIHNRTLIGGDLESMIALDRFKMKEGFSLDWQAQFLYNKKQKLISLLQYWFSLDQRGGWLSWSLIYHFSPQTWMHFECNILGLESSSQDGFFGQYANNDRIAIGVRYGF